MPSLLQTPPHSTPARPATLLLDRADECVWLGGEKVTLAPKAFGLLRHLAEHRGRLVTKDDLLDAVWPGVFVGDAVLKVAVREIRAALDDDAKEPRFIQTVHRRGYRFIGEVELVDAAPAAAHGLRFVSRAVQAAPRSTLAGRADALDQLRSALAASMTGERQAVFVTGEPGIGKTTLVEAFLDELRGSSSVIVARGQCLELSGTSEAYLPFLDAFGRLLREPGQEPLVELMRRCAPTWLRQMPSVLDRDAQASLESEVRGATRERMLREMAEAIEVLSLEHPVVIVLEDLHWSDGSTVDLISALARRREPARVLLIGTYRPGEIVLDRHPLRAVKDELQLHRLCSEIALGLLRGESVSALVESRLGPHRLPPAFISLLHERTDGNPLFLVAVLSYLVDRASLRQGDDGVWTLDGALDEIETGVPDNLRVMIEKQIDRLSEEEQRLLEAASLAGLEFSSTTVGAALEREEFDVEELCAALVRRGQFIVSRGVEPAGDRIVERFAFTHSIYQQVFHRRVGPARRARLHLRIGEAGRAGLHLRIGERGEALYGRRAGEIAGELAVHFEQGRDVPRAVVYLRLAAENAVRRSANNEALACLTRALSLIESFDHPASADVRIGLCEQIGLVLRSMGDVAVAAEQFLQMAGFASSAGRTDDEARAWMYAASALSWLDRERCLRAAERAERLPVGDGVLRAHVAGYAAYARLIWNRWSPADAAACEHAAEATRGSGDMELFGFHVGRFVHVQAMRGDYAEAALTADEGLRLAGPAADPYDALMCRFWQSWALLHMGAWEEMRAIIGTALQVTERNGHGRLSLLFRLALAWLHEESGEFEEASSICEAALADAREAKYAFGELIAHVVLGMAYLGRRDSERARRTFDAVEARLQQERVLMDWIWRMPLAWGQGRLELETGRVDAAAARGRELLALAETAGEPTWLALGYTLLAQAAIARRRWSVAEGALDAALAIVRQRAVPLAAWRVHATATELHARQRREDEARDARRSRDTALSRLPLASVSRVSRNFQPGLTTAMSWGS